VTFEVNILIDLAHYSASRMICNVNFYSSLRSSLIRSLVIIAVIDLKFQAFHETVHCSRERERKRKRQRERERERELNKNFYAVLVIFVFFTACYFYFINCFKNTRKKRFC